MPNICSYSVSSLGYIRLMSTHEYNRGEEAQEDCARGRLSAKIGVLKDSQRRKCLDSALILSKNRVNPV